MGTNCSRWCEFHKINNRDTKKFYALIQQIKKLIREGPLAKYAHPKIDCELLSGKDKIDQRHLTPSSYKRSLDKTQTPIGNIWKL